MTLTHNKARREAAQRRFERKMLSLDVIAACERGVHYPSCPHYEAMLRREASRWLAGGSPYRETCAAHPYAD